jgi:MFS family permease
MDVLNASHKSVGFMESFALFSAFGAKLFSGVLSDYFKRRKPLIIIGTCATLLGKIGFFYASSILHVFFARAWDRFAKGIRSTPTDALIADCSSSKNRAQSYGARQMLYSLGNVAGGVTATCLMYLTSKNYRLIFFLSLLPALCGLFILIRSITDAPYLKRIPWKWRDATKLPKPFWIVMGIMFFLMMGRFSNAFINLRIKVVGWPVEVVHVILFFFYFFF